MITTQNEMASRLKSEEHFFAKILAEKIFDPDYIGNDANEKLQEAFACIFQHEHSDLSIQNLGPKVNTNSL